MRSALLVVGTLALIFWHASRAYAQAPANAQPLAYTPSAHQGPLRIGIIGLVHGHVEGLLWQASQRDDITIVGVAEPDRALFDRLAAKYKLDPSLYHASTAEMLDAAKPEAVSVMTAIVDHRDAAEACAPRGVHMLFEKPLAFSADDGRRIESLARTHRVLALTNFETSWYTSVREVQKAVANGDRAPIRRMVFRHGHKGPKEIGCGPEFLDWLTNPARNGGGAIVDFGCYGIALSTWLTDGQRPTRVTATASTLKPATYPNVDDDATIVLSYPTATAVVQASWAWTHDNKEMDVHTERGSLHAGKWKDLFVREENGPATRVEPEPMPGQLKDEWTYLRQVVRGRCEVDPLSSIELNVIVAEVLDEARRQVREASDPGPELDPAPTSRDSR